MGVSFGKARIKQQPEHFPVIGLADITPTSLASDSEARAAGATPGLGDRPQTGQAIFHQQAAVVQDPALHAHRHDLPSGPATVVYRAQSFE